MIQKEFFGTMADGTEVTRYTATNRNGVSASFLDLGGVWNTMFVPDRQGVCADVVLGYDSVKGIQENLGHPGEIVGRHANRVGGAKYTLNGVTYELPVNSAPNNLHSGPHFYRDRIWGAEAFQREKECGVVFTLESPDGDQGFPGNASVRVTYTLTDEDELRIHYELICDQDTICNLTNHAYFNLAGHDGGNAMDQEVWIDGDAITPMNGNLVPDGSFRPVKGTPMDFTERKAIGRDIEADYDQLRIGIGYDHNWVLNHAPGVLALCAKAWDRKSGRTMEVYTDLPGVQFYTANYLPDGVQGKQGVTYGRRCGYCFETQYYPNAVNTPQFPSPILRKGEKFDSTTIYRFGLE